MTEMQVLPCHLSEDFNIHTSGSNTQNHRGRGSKAADCPSCGAGDVPYRKQLSHMWLEDSPINIISNILWGKKGHFTLHPLKGERKCL